SILGQWRRTNTYADGIFRMFGTGSDAIPTLQRFMKQPEFAPAYYRELKNLAETIFSPSQMDPLLDQLKDSFGSGPEFLVAIGNMKAFNVSNRAYVLSQIPLQLTVSNNLAINNGYPRATSSTVALHGTANVIETRSVLVNGSPATWTAW